MFAANGERTSCQERNATDRWDRMASGKRGRNQRRRRVDTAPMRLRPGQAVKSRKQLAQRITSAR